MCRQDMQHDTPADWKPALRQSEVIGPLTGRLEGKAFLCGRARVSADPFERGHPATPREWKCGPVCRDGMRTGGEASGARRGDPRCPDPTAKPAPRATGLTSIPRSLTRSSPSWGRPGTLGPALGNGGGQGAAEAHGVSPAGEASPFAHIFGQARDTERWYGFANHMR